ncbi:MAG: DUF4271 domain-containing protein [Chitinophagaceae bacterium]
MSIVTNAQTDSLLQKETTAVKKTVVKPLITPKKIVIKKDTTNVTLPATVILKDSLLVKDSLAIDSILLAKQLDSLRNDSLKKQQALAAVALVDTSTYGNIIGDIYFPVFLPPSFKVDIEKKHQSKDELFYLLLSLLALVAFIKVVFPKYFGNMFSVFFQSSFRQKQTRDQLMHNNFASLLLNIVFVLSFGTYLAVVATNNQWVKFEFWWLVLSCMGILTLVYLIKFLFLYFSGWIFNSLEAAKTYLFIVFLSNKIIAILLIPLLLIIAFSGGEIASVALIVSLFLIAGGIIYRYLVTLSSIRSELNVSALHFFLYLCSFEILPLALIYKAVFNYIGTTI